MAASAESRPLQGLLKCRRNDSALTELSLPNGRIPRFDFLPHRRILEPGGSQVAHNQPDPHSADAFGQVLRFRPRPGQPRLVGSAAQPGEEESGDPFTQYEQEQERPINYRQRMLMNVIALAIVALLVGAGVWIADTIEVLQKDQDCVLQGRANCAPIEIPIPRQQ
jgi:hypothetical protein